MYRHTLSDPIMEYVEGIFNKYIWYTYFVCGIELDWHIRRENTSANNMSRSKHRSYRGPPHRFPINNFRGQKRTNPIFDKWTFQFDRYYLPQCSQILQIWLHILFYIGHKSNYSWKHDVLAIFFQFPSVSYLFGVS